MEFGGDWKGDEELIGGGEIARDNAGELSGDEARAYIGDDGGELNGDDVGELEGLNLARGNKMVRYAMHWSQMTEEAKARFNARRRVHRDWHTAAAGRAIGKLDNGEIFVFGFSNASFSYADMIFHCLEETGPADVLITAWTIGVEDAQKLAAARNMGKIKSLRCIVDYSLGRRKPELANALVEAVGIENIRSSKWHAKVTTIFGDDLQVAVTSSGNTNKWTSMEHWTVCTGELAREIGRHTAHAWGQLKQDDLFWNSYFKGHRAPDEGQRVIDLGAVVRDNPPELFDRSCKFLLKSPKFMI